MLLYSKVLWCVDAVAVAMPGDAFKIVTVDNDASILACLHAYTHTCIHTIKAYACVVLAHVHAIVSEVRQYVINKSSAKVQHCTEVLLPLQFIHYFEQNSAADASASTSAP